MGWSQGFIAVDWGTSNRRAYRIDAAGRNCAEFEDDKGVLSVGDGGFPAAIGEIRERLGDLPLLLAGMIGSSRGWKEAPYVASPAGLDEIAKALVWAGEREAIVPGVSFVGGGRADVMRGEEVQLLGAVAAGLIEPHGLVCHPGTHNKWAIMRDGRIEEFRTVMTGELFALLKEHSILSDLLGAPVEVNDAFRAAARHGLSNQAVAAELFGVRARILLGLAAPEEAAAYISGLLIGADVRTGLAGSTPGRVAVMGRPELTRLYAAAISEAGGEPFELDGEECFLAGAIKIAERI
ncbi:MAG TPA: 2-dehydro-3-deoxygalactonokinase [Sphingomicrobium sp.]|nr:2-dehydro-3-deoxygalactonokinase [Sphingomicrobium sp.]